MLGCNWQSLRNRMLHSTLFLMIPAGVQTREQECKHCPLPLPPFPRGIIGHRKESPQEAAQEQKLGLKITTFSDAGRRAEHNCVTFRYAQICQCYLHIKRLQPVDVDALDHEQSAALGRQSIMHASKLSHRDSRHFRTHRHGQWLYDGFVKAVRTRA